MGWAEKILDLARRVDRNVPEHTNPEKFHEEKSEIRESLKKIANGDPS
ncbi:MAG: hypothetical protein M3O03_12565 [Pseudomonadota bacterium]|nr:hypothetical protein [Pseudomonadota bacterium]